MIPLDLPITLQSEPEPEAPTGGEILCALCDRFDAQPEEVLTWLGEFKPQAAYAEYLAELGRLPSAEARPR